MKKIFITLFCLSISTAVLYAQDKKNAPAANPNAAQQTAAQQQQAAPAAPAAPDPNAGSFKFKEETHDFGTVPEGPLAEYDFEFKNDGKSPIVITEAHGSCGCTVPSWPHEPILPKKKGVIHVAYTTNGRQGMINKDVIITSNAQQSPMRLHITGNVTPKPTPPATPAPTPNTPPAPAPASK